MVFVDYADVTLTWGRSIIAHELQHLLHNALDPYENLYIDEGNADVAIYLCFGADSTLTGHVNGWTQNSGLSVRWWNQRNADYGAGFMLMMYLVDHLGGGPAMRQLVQDGATGGSGITNLATAPANGQAGLVGTTMDQVFANFSVAARWIQTRASTAIPTCNSTLRVPADRFAGPNPRPRTAIGPRPTPRRATPWKDGASVRSNSPRCCFASAVDASRDRRPC